MTSAQNTIGKPFANLLLVAVLLGAGALGIYGGYLLFGPSSDKDLPSGEVGKDPGATRLRLRDVSAALVKADKKGDGELASQVRELSAAMLMTIESQPPEVASKMRGCLLGARLLTAGATTVQRGGRWQDEDRFQAAVSDCR